MSSSNSFDCPICFEKFNKRCHQPVTVSCGHTFCLFCLRQTNANSAESECVLCRRQISTDPGRFSKNILILDLLEHTNQLGKDDLCMSLDCSICNPQLPKNSPTNPNEQEEISEQEMIDQIVGDLEIFLQQRPETITFMLNNERRQAERNLLDAFFALLDECADERRNVLDAADLFAGREIDEELGQVEVYGRQFETLCVYMITAVLRLRTLNSFTAYSLQRIRTYFPLRNRLEFVELTSEFDSSASTNTRRLEDRLLRASQSNSIYRQMLVNQCTSSRPTDCSFIEYISNQQLHHCLICNCVIQRSTNADSVDQHVQELSHQFLLQEVERLPFEILLRRSNAYRIQINTYSRLNRERQQNLEDVQSRPTTGQQTTRSNAETRQPTFFS